MIVSYSNFEPVSLNPNLFKATSTALIVPSNSIINLNNNNLKGYDAVIPKELRGDIGKVYKKFILDKANARMNDDKIGGTLEQNISHSEKIQNLFKSFNSTKINAFFAVIVPFGISLTLEVLSFFLSMSLST